MHDFPHHSLHISMGTNTENLFNYHKPLKMVITSPILMFDSGVIPKDEIIRCLPLAEIKGLGNFHPRRPIQLLKFLMQQIQLCTESIKFF